MVSALSVIYGVGEDGAEGGSVLPIPGYWTEKAVERYEDLANRPS